MEHKLRIFIADDENLFRNAVQTVLNAQTDMQVVGWAAEGIDAVKQIKLLRPDLVLLDIRMPEMNGIDCIKEIRGFSTDIQILILTTFNESEYIIEGLANGANGYLLKSPDFSKLIQSIRQLVSGQYLLSTEVATKLATYLLDAKQSSPGAQPNPPVSLHSLDQFTAREKEVIRLLLNRLTNKEIAQHLFVTEGTVKNYLTTIYEKLNVKTRLEAIRELQAQI